MIARRLAAAAIFATLLLGACSGDSPDRDDDGRIVSSGDLGVYDLRVGDCVLFDSSVESANETVPVVPCEEPHQAEIYALVELEDLDQYPGERELSDRAELECIATFGDYVGAELADSTLFFTYMIPAVRGWQEDGDRTVVCLALGVGGPLEGSLRGSGI